MSTPKVDARFEILRVAGRGAMGIVYKAWDRVTASPVALKIPSPSLHERFRQEATVLAAMDHPHIVRYRGHGRSRTGKLWLAMEWLDGEDLEHRLGSVRLSLDEVLRLALPVADAMAWAHVRRFVHRDLKPMNLILPDGDVARVKLLDFGLARPLRDSAELTATGTFMGTMEYMPPEQRVDAKRADARSDVYSLGAVLFHCLTGEPPSGAAPWEPVRERRPSELRADIPALLDDLVARMLSPDPAERPADGGAVLSGLKEVRSSIPWSWDRTAHRDPSAFEATAELPVVRGAEGPSGTMIMPSRGRCR